MNREDPPQDYPQTQQVIVEALPKSTIVVAGAFYVVLAALMSWVLMVSVDTASQVKVTNTKLEYLARDRTDDRARADRTELRLDAIERRMYEERPSQNR